MSERMSETLQDLQKTGAAPFSLARIQAWVEDATKLQDQIRRRLLKHEKIPHAEKLFSVYEHFTRWISKGKAGREVELGVPLSVLEGPNGFILSWRLLARR